MSTKTSILLLLTLNILFCKGHNLTYEQYQNLKGKDFCAAKDADLNQKLCVKLGELNNFTGFLIESLTFSKCVDREVSIYSEKSRQDVKFTDKLLYCGYNRNDDDVVEYDPTQRTRRVIEFRTRGLGRGMEVNDAMEYHENRRIQYGRFMPLKNQKNLLEEILYLQDHEHLEGEDFCNSENVDVLPQLCIKIAKKHNVIISTKSAPFGKCFKKDIALLSKDNGKNEIILENLLFCMYNDQSDAENEEYIASKEAHRISKSEIRVLGKGKLAKDVMEYKLYKTDTYMPYENLSDFLSAA